MGNLSATYKKAIIDELVTNITTGTSNYYAFAANPVPFTGNTPAITYDDYTFTFTSDWQMMFGKKLMATDISPVISNNPWTANTKYNRYDNTPSGNLTNFYVVTAPVIGGGYNIYKCIDNANGMNSTVAPSLIQPGTFATSDGYKWRYITSISSESYIKFATSAYVPVSVNTTISTSAYNYSGIDVVMINSGGSNYNTYYNGTIQGVSGGGTILQIDATASLQPNVYALNSIYITGSYTAELHNITNYVANTTGNWVYIDAPVNTNNINPGVSTYRISPRVVFNTDAVSPPLAYSVVNPVSNSIANVVIISPGYGATWVNVSIVTNPSYGSGANLYAIVPPAGGHGSEPESELFLQGFAASFVFANTESGNVITSATYNKIGIIKNPYSINATSFNSTNTYFTANAFNQVLQATTNTATLTTFANGSLITGLTSNATGTVVFSNTSTLYLTGDKYFTNNESVTDGISTTQISINTIGSIYAKGIKPLYVQNISNVTRSNTQTESFKLIVQI